jgi:hypothetical protein
MMPVLVDEEPDTNSKYQSRREKNTHTHTHSWLFNYALLVHSCNVQLVKPSKMWDVRNTLEQVKITLATQVTAEVIPLLTL